LFQQRSFLDNSELVAFEEEIRDKLDNQHAKQKVMGSQLREIPNTKRELLRGNYTMVAG